MLNIILTIFFAVAAPGQDASVQAGINWHSTVPGSTLQVTKAGDEAFKKAKTYSPEEQLWSLPQGDSLFRIQRYVCRVNLDGLRPDKDYICRVVSSDGTSDIMKIHTAPTRARAARKPWKFQAFVDFQIAYNKNTSMLMDRFNSMFEGQAQKPLFSLCSGDLIDYGSREAEWRWSMESVQKTGMLFAASPGDHEYWGYKPDGDVHITQMAEPFGYNAIFNNPKNGCEPYKNSNYFFHYGNVLFIALNMGDSNTSRCDDFITEAEWFHKTVQEQKGTYDYLVVFGHKSVYGSKETDSGVRKYLSPIWMKEFKEAGVNLAIGGHDHKYSRTGCVDGTWFLDMGSSGAKYRVPEEAMYQDKVYEKILDLKATNDAVGAVITVDRDGLHVEVVNLQGTVVDKFDVIK